MDETDDEDAEEHGDKDGGYGSEGGEIVDVEDLGTHLQRTSGGAIDESAPAERKPMVTNAQFPEQMETLRPCTQLYISVDAPTATELKAVDRPLFADFWERFLKCVDLLREKQQRTVFRLTLVNGWNTEQLDECVWLPDDR
ncbi:tRNA wybutosine-synthesizing protein 1-like protein [Chrysochromulina tobinii]|uniref:tRNA wybutosine-synthesizing protein 1-like protein n=1 Tax=Chrysochromulina tobinii TaxID=1460289 RepID=A0A0M0K2H0_9EUKA|nr:tRNA wybutosine-synthesizing protein 1-like protein [Chrysochromulina tobinii]|eukprot:KOO32999.1 tRNA wybutosine-synthesizing protein 1-like protein [Chrysochromulina sp. CCMP291]